MEIEGVDKEHLFGYNNNRMTRMGQRGVGGRMPVHSILFEKVSTVFVHHSINDTVELLIKIT